MLVKCFKAASKAIIKTIVALIIAALVACWAVPYAYEERGYMTAFGGEALLVLTTFVLSLWFLSRDFRKILKKYRKERKEECLNATTAGE